MAEEIEETDVAELDLDDEDSLSYISSLHKKAVDQGQFYMSPILKNELKHIQDLVLHKDRDWLGIFDGDEGSGKSVLAMQVMKSLDPTFDIDRIVWTADDFIDKIKKLHKGQAVLLDEGYAAASARGSLSEVNKALVAMATEMRQKNLFVGMCIPSIFDLDKYFAIHRGRALFHVYFNSKGDRGQFIIYPKSAKKLLYLYGKKNYSYSKPVSPYPAMRFLKHYVVDEVEYRKRKADAFKKRTASNRAKQWLNQRDSFIKELFYRFQMTQEEISKIPLKYESKPLTQQAIARILLGKGRF